MKSDVVALLLPGVFNLAAAFLTELRLAFEYGVARLAAQLGIHGFATLSKLRADFGDADQQHVVPTGRTRN